MYAGWSLDVIAVVIENRLNRIWHSSVKNIPDLLVTSYRNCEIVRVQQKDNSKTLKRSNRRRKEHKYAPGDEILLKTVNPSKTELFTQAHAKYDVLINRMRFW